MKLNRVTITGADETVTPQRLINLSYEYPFVEWGILFSSSAQGKKSRYPSLEWINNFISIITEQVNNIFVINISAHICGKYVRDLLIGNNTLPSIVRVFPRLQLNFKYFDSIVDEEKFIHLLSTDEMFQNKEIIFQLRNDVNDNLFYKLEKIFNDTNVKVSGLLDCSGGTGKELNLNTQLLTSIYNTYFGYAGGINVNNIGLVIKELLAKGTNNEHYKFWIDMESGVRTLVDDKDLFDLNKVNDCLLTAKNYII